MSPLALLLLAQAPFAFEVPGRVDEVTVPVPVSTAGYEVRISAARSKRSPAELLSFYARAMVEAGLYVAPPARQPRLVNELHLTGLDTARLVAYTVVLQPRKSGGTSVMMTQASLGAPAPAPAPSVPIFPGASPPVVTRSEGGTATSYSVRGVDARTLGAWYRAMLVGAGWAERAPLELVKGAAALSVHVGTPSNGALPVMVLERSAL